MARFASAIDMIKHHEGLSLHPYRCTSGAWTIGYGHNLDTAPIGIALDLLHRYGISEKGADRLLAEDLETVSTNLATVDEFNRLDTVRQAVLLDMGFNLGFRGLMGFKRMWNHIESRAFVKAAAEMLDSKWALQVKGRAHRLALMMQTGEWPVR